MMERANEELETDLVWLLGGGRGVIQRGDVNCLRSHSNDQYCVHCLPFTKTRWRLRLLNGRRKYWLARYCFIPTNPSLGEFGGEGGYQLGKGALMGAIYHSGSRCKETGEIFLHGFQTNEVDRK